MRNLISLLVLLTLSTPVFAQSTQQKPPTPPNPDAQVVGAEDNPQEESTPPPKHDPKATTNERSDAAWSMLTDAVTNAKKSDLRIQALAALGTMGTNTRSTKIIVDALSDPDLDVRTAAVLAAGQTEDRSLTTNLRNMLDDPQPQVAFAAATTLWKMHDPSGETLLIAVVNGERNTNDGPVKGAIHTAQKDLHRPGTLFRLGTLQGASLLLGPFGFGVGAFEYMRKNGAGDLPRVSAIEQLSESNTGPIRTTLIQAIGDKNPAVRAAAAKAVGRFHDAEAQDALYAAFDDNKAPVRLTAAAAYLNSIAPPPPNKTTHPPTSKASRRRLQ